MSETCSEMIQIFEAREEGRKEGEGWLRSSTAGQHSHEIKLLRMHRAPVAIALDNRVIQVAPAIRALELLLVRQPVVRRLDGEDPHAPHVEVLVEVGRA